MPERDNFDRTTPNAIVEVVTNPGEMKTTEPAHPSAREGRTDQRLGAQQQKGLRDIVIEGLRCEIAVLIPPMSGPLDLTLCAFRDAYLHGD
jgi:hypothetical protein